MNKQFVDKTSTDRHALNPPTNCRRDISQEAQNSLIYDTDAIRLIRYGPTPNDKIESLGIKRKLNVQGLMSGSIELNKNFDNPHEAALGTLLQ